MPNKKYRALIVLLGLLLCARVSLQAQTPAAPDPQKAANIAKVHQLLQQSGYNARKTGDSTWLLEYPGNGRRILAAADREFVVLGVVVVEKKNLKQSSDLYFKLLKLNHTLDYVKIVLDEDDDLVVRSEVRSWLLDLRQIKAMVEDLNKSAIKIQQEIAPFLVTP